MRTVYVSDLDGTLLDSNARLSEFTRRGVEQLLEQGILFTVASARSLFSIRSILGDLPLSLPVISFNGGYVSDYSTGRHWAVHGLPPELVWDVQSRLERLGLHPFVSTHCEAGDHLYVGKTLNPAMAWFYEERQQEGDTRLRQVDDICKAYDEVVTCISVMGERAPLEALLTELIGAHGSQIQPHLFENMYVSGAYWLTLHAAAATKANGLRTMLEIADLDAVHTVVFGDHHNDIEMFRHANESIAVEDAVPELKAIATQCIGSNDADSVLHEIRRRYLPVG